MNFKYFNRTCSNLYYEDFDQYTLIPINVNGINLTIYRKVKDYAETLSAIEGINYLIHNSKEWEEGEYQAENFIKNHLNKLCDEIINNINNYTINEVIIIMISKIMQLFKRSFSKVSKYVAIIITMSALEIGTSLKGIKTNVQLENWLNTIGGAVISSIYKKYLIQNLSFIPISKASALYYSLNFKRNIKHNEIIKKQIQEGKTIFGDDNKLIFNNLIYIANAIPEFKSTTYRVNEMVKQGLNTFLNTQMLEIKRLNTLHNKLKNIITIFAIKNLQDSRKLVSKSSQCFLNPYISLEQPIIYKFNKLKI